VWDPALIHVNDAFARLVHCEHLLCIEASEHLAAFRVASKGNALNLPIRELELVLEDVEDRACRDTPVVLLLDEALQLLDRPH